MELTTVQAAERLGVTPNTVLNLIKRGQLPTVNARKEGATKFFPKIAPSAVQAFLKAQRETGARWPPVGGHPRRRVFVPDVPTVGAANGNGAATAIPADMPTSGILTRLAAIEEAVGRIELALIGLQRLWQ